MLHGTMLSVATDPSGRHARALRGCMRVRAFTPSHKDVALSYPGSARTLSSKQCLCREFGPAVIPAQQSAVYSWQPLPGTCQAPALRALWR